MTLISVRLGIVVLLVLFAGFSLGSSTTGSANFDLFVGRYQIEPDKVMTISRFRDQLYSSTAGEQALPMFATKENQFSYDDDAVITFETDAAGKITGVRFDRKDFHSKGPKISDDPRGEPVVIPEAFDSPRIAKLSDELKRGNAAALDQFWKDLQDNAPLVESIADDPHRSWVTFVYRGDADTRTVRRDGGPNAFSGDGTATNLQRLHDTNLWYRTERIPNDARFVYAFGVNCNVQQPNDPTSTVMRRLSQQQEKADPLNPKFLHANTQGDFFPALSILEMPEAPPQPYVKPIEGNRKGTVTDGKIESEILKQTREISVYTPPHHDPKASAAYPLVIFFDGGAYRSDSSIPTPTIVDNLIAAKKIEPPVVVFVHQKERAKELNCSEPFAEFVAKEVVSWARANYRATDDPAHTTIGGLSLGGVMATYCALKHPEVFGNVLSQSGAFWVYPGCFDERPPLYREGSLAADFMKSPRLPLRFYLEAGRFENFSQSNLLGENRRLRDVLLAKGYEVSYSEFSGGHSAISWRGSLAEGLIALSKPRVNEPG